MSGKRSELKLIKFRKTIVEKSKLKICLSENEFKNLRKKRKKVKEKRVHNIRNRKSDVIIDMNN